MPKKSISELLALGQVLLASQLAQQKSKTQQKAAEYDLAVEAELSHRRTKIATGPMVKPPPP
jgi:hypothetical protein